MWSTSEQCVPLKIPGTSKGYSEGLLINHSPGRDLVVVLHATGNDMHYPWRQVILQFIRHQVQVLIFDLPGHGRDSSDILTENAYLCVANALNEAKKFTHWNKIFGIGQSLGAMLLLQSACSSNIPFTKLSLWGLPDGKKISAAAMTELLFIFNRNFWQLRFDYGWRNIFPAFMSIKRQDFPVRVQGANYISEVLALLRSISISISPENVPPTQFLIGYLDFIASREYVLKLSNRINHSQVETIMESHFTTMFSREAADKASVWFELD